MKKAFTLIELLVVIAIIAILAAILFPVFAQAKEAAKKTSCLSNVKQICLGMMLYVNDYDDVTPTILGPRGSNTSYQIDWYTQITPYVKSFNLFFCPDRDEWTLDSNGDTCNDSFDYGQSGTGVQFNRTGKCVGFGYNWGFASFFSTGLVQGRTNNSQWRINAGNSTTLAASPAQMFAFGDTGDSPRYTICADYLDQYYNITKKSDLRHAGHNNMAFLDGHAKNVNFNAAISPAVSQNGGTTLGVGNTIEMPQNVNDAYDYCLDPNAVDPAATQLINEAGISGTFTCSQAINIIYGVSTFVPSN